MDGFSKNHNKMILFIDDFKFTYTYVDRIKNYPVTVVENIHINDENKKISYSLEFNAPNKTYTLTPEILHSLPQRHKEEISKIKNHFCNILVPLITTPKLRINIGEQETFSPEIDDFVPIIVAFKGKYYEELRPYVINYSFVGIEKWQNNKWQVIRKDVDCLCHHDCKKKPTQLFASDDNKNTKLHTWDFKDGDCNFVKNGKYRIVIPYLPTFIDSRDQKDFELLAISKKFFIFESNINKLPEVDKIKHININSISNKYNLTSKDFKKLFKTAKIITIENPPTWNYATSNGGSFIYNSKKYEFTLFFGGRGRLITPNNIIIEFEFNHN